MGQDSNHLSKSWWQNALFTSLISLPGLTLTGHLVAVQLWESYLTYPCFRRSLLVGTELVEWKPVPSTPTCAHEIDGIATPVHWGRGGNFPVEKGVRISGELSPGLCLGEQESSGSPMEARQRITAAQPNKPDH